jgi:predicted ATPase
VRAEYKMAYELAGQLLRLAQSQQNSAFLVQAYYALGLTSFYLGEFVAARQGFKQSVALYDPQQHRSHAFLYGFDPKPTCLSFVAEASCYLGYPDQALKELRHALALAQELSHPFTTAGVLNNAIWVYQLLREEQATQEYAETLIALCDEQGFALYLAWGTIMRGWALAEQRRRDEGMAQMSQGFDTYRATGAELQQPQFLALLAEAYGKRGQVEEGLSAVTEALTVVDKNEERFYEAELHRLKGKLLLQSPVSKSQAEAEQCFQQALAIARQQSAKSLELRAAMSLARLWQQQGKQQEAHRMLSEISGWFTEGFDTKDLQEAKAMLDELEVSRP